MIQRYSDISLGLGISGLAMQIVGNHIATSNGEQVSGLAAIMGFPFFMVTYTMAVLYQPEYALTHHHIPIFLTGSVLVIAAFVYYAKAKNRSGWFGLFGLVFPIGLLFFAVLKDETSDV